MMHRNCLLLLNQTKPSNHGECSEGLHTSSGIGTGYIAFREHPSRILSEHGVLPRESEFLLRTEFGIREPRTYYTILRAIATGKRKANEIASFAGVDSNSLGFYLSKLRRLRLVERDIPVTANPNATRKSGYLGLESS